MSEQSEGVVIEWASPDRSVFYTVRLAYGETYVIDTNVNTSYRKQSLRDFSARGESEHERAAYRHFYRHYVESLGMSYDDGMRHFVRAR